MDVSRASWVKYINALRQVSQKATDSMDYYIQSFGMPQTEAEIEEFVYAAYNVSTKYGEAAAELAAQMYDVVADLSGMALDPAMPAQTATYAETAKAVRGTLKTGNGKIVTDAVGRLVKMAGVDTTMKNAIRDGASWAWVPNGDTCAFCITLASRGWQRASKKALNGGHATHIHANCDCTYAIRFNERDSVQGYDPEEYQDMYYGADLDGTAPTAKNRINAMRREFYAENKVQINEQKRDAYQKREERNSSAAEETNVD